MSVVVCSTCRTELAPAEAPTCQGCGQRPSTTIGDRAVAVLERADAPLLYWDIQRLMDRQHGWAPGAGSLLVYLSRDLRVCWAGKGMYGLYRHGLIPNVRGLGPTAEAHLLGAPSPLRPEELHFVLQHQGYRHQYASLTAALRRQLGHTEGMPPPQSDAELVRRKQRLAELLQISRRSPRFEPYAAALRDRVAEAVQERARRLVPSHDAQSDDPQSDS
jgi:hypothetical protein